MSRHDPTTSLLHMRDHTAKALEFAAGKSRADLDQDEMLRLVLTHLVELVGEAASRVPDEMRRAHPEIPWSDAIALRHRLIHGYDSVDYDILWSVITVDLPPLLVDLQKICQS